MKPLLLLCVFLKLRIVALAQETLTPNAGVADSESSSKSSSSHNIEVAALGRSAQLGDLYDAVNDRLLWSVFKNQKDSFDHLNVITTNINSSKIDIILNETLSEKMEKLDIQPPLLLSRLGSFWHWQFDNRNLISGASKYLNKDKRSAKSVTAALVYKIRTVREELQVTNISESVINDIRNDRTYHNSDQIVTHIVVGIEWGVDAVLSVEFPNQDPSNATQIHGKLIDALKAAGDMITTTDKIDSSRFVEVEMGNIKGHVDLYSDYDYSGIAETLTIPKNPNDYGFMPISRCLSSIKTLPDAMKNKRINEEKHLGKGKRVKYILMPINKFRENFGEKVDARDEVKQLSKEMNEDFLQIFQNLEDTEVQIRDIENVVRIGENIFSESEDDEITDIRQRYDNFWCHWVCRDTISDGFQKKIKDFRQNFTGDDELHSLISLYRNSTWTPEGTKITLDSISPKTLLKIKWMNRLLKAEASFVEESDEMHILSNNGDEEIRIVSLDLNDDNAEHYVNEIVKLLEVELVKTSGKVKYYIEVPVKKPKVKAYRQGRLINKFIINSLTNETLVAKFLRKRFRVQGLGS